MSQPDPFSSPPPSTLQRIGSWTLMAPTLQVPFAVQPTMLAGKRGLRFGGSFQVSSVQYSPVWSGLHGVPQPVVPQSTRWTHSLRFGAARSAGAYYGNPNAVEFNVAAETAMAVGRNQMLSPVDVGVGVTAKFGYEADEKTGEDDNYRAADLTGRVTYYILRPDLYQSGPVVGASAVGAVGVGHNYHGPSEGKTYLDYDYGVWVEGGWVF